MVLSIAVTPESIACMPLEKLICHLSVFNTSALKQVSVYNVDRGCNPQTFGTFRYSRLLLRDFRVRGEENIPWGLNSVS